MKVRFRKLHPNAVIPSYAKPGDAGLDLTAISKRFDHDSNCWVYGTGLAMEIPEGHVGLIFPRSSIFKKSLNLSNAVGVIDSGYRGEVSFFFREHLPCVNVYDVGDRIGQLVVLSFPKVEIEEASELSETVRGTGGFGSSGS